MIRRLTSGLAGLGLTLALTLAPTTAAAAPQPQLCALPEIMQLGFQACPQPLFLNPQGQFMTPQGMVVSAPGFFLNPQGQIVTPQGLVISPTGFVTTPQGLTFNPDQLDDDAHGRLVGCVARNAPRDGHGQIVRAVAREGLDAADDSLLLGNLITGCLAEMASVNATTTTFAPITIVNSGRGDDDHDRNDDHGGNRGNRGRGNDDHGGRGRGR